jgi:hypothetical protein
MKFLKQLEFEEPTKILELHYLIRHPSLEAIEISWASKLKDEDLLYLKNIPNLKKLHLGFAYSLRSLAGLAGAQKLTELEISFACFTSFWETSEKFDLIDITPQNFPELTSLDLSVDRLAESGISSLKEMKNLTYLKVHVYKDPPFDWSPLKNHPSLRRVHVTKDDVKTPSFWKTLATWPRIEMVFGDGVHALTKEQRNELAKKNIVVGDFGITKNPISSYRR